MSRETYAKDEHLRHREDKGGSHLGHAMRHLHEHRTAEHHDVEQHADRHHDEHRASARIEQGASGEHDRAGGGRDDASAEGVREGAEGTMERGAGVSEAKGVAGRAKIWDEGGSADQPHPHSRSHSPGV